MLLNYSTTSIGALFYPRLPCNAPASLLHTSSLLEGASSLNSYISTEVPSPDTQKVRHRTSNNECLGVGGLGFGKFGGLAEAVLVAL